MKKTLKTLLFFGLLVLGFYNPVSNAQVTNPINNVPDYYHANYQFIDDWNRIWDIFKEIRSRYDINMSIDSSYFRELHTHFQNSFKYLVKDYSTVYEKCTLLAEQYARWWATRMEVQWFLWNSCYKILSDAAWNITSRYTVRARWKANFNWWSAPVTITFDARGSVDPSSETIPTDNFFWYYRDENGVDTPMGKWSVINYEFKEAWTFIVHLVVRSSNANKGILDGEQDLTIEVAPKAANIVVYANTRKMNAWVPTKIWISEWKKWVVFDGSATMPRWWRAILSHKWEISFGWSVIYSRSWEGTPSYINVPLDGNGEFKITLTTLDNENNKVSETFSLYMTDPVTVIKQTPAIWTTSTTMTFDASASYSITSRLNTYVWEVFDEEWNRVAMEQWKKMSKIFTQPWNYIVRLTVTDIAGFQNVDTKNLYIESTTPTPQFTATPTMKWTYPSEFTLDASNSTDVDVLNGYDSLEYSWKFSDTENTKIVSTENNNEKIVVQFNTLWKHTIKLTATDQYGKYTSISKVIDIKSTLRPEIEAIPWAITWWKIMKFKSTVNRPVINYKWDYWDKTTTSSQYASETWHTYNQRWIYTVNLTVYDAEWNYNTVTEKVFIWEIEYPIAAYRVKNSWWFYIKASDTCKITWSNWLQEVDAYPINRYANFTIDPSISVNTQWNWNWLTKVFEPESIMWTNQSIIKSDLTHRFSLTGCHYVDLTVQDSNIWKQDKVRIWFNVKNALPTIKNVTLSFPQYWDNSGVGFGWMPSSNSSATTFDCSWTSNLTVKATAVNAADSDGSISRLRFYYYNVDDPTRIIEYKETWMSAPYAYFVLPRISWEYKFWVMVYDNDGGMVDTEELLGSNPSIYFPAQCNDSEVPSVTLKTSSQNIEVWDTVTYTIISRISNNNDDFETDRTFYFDFTWDWVWDLVTKKDKATYTFIEPFENWVKPRAAVEYRWKVGRGEWAEILVRNWIKPIMLYNSHKNTVIFRDLSIWTFQQRQICFDVDECSKWNTKFQRTHVVTLDVDELTWWTSTSITQNDSFLRNYSEYGNHNVSLYLKNKYGIEVKTGFVVKTTSNTNNWLIAPGVNMITIPETTFTNTNPEIFLSKAMNNTLLMYISNENWGTCYVDTDIATDSDWDSKTDNDVDISCNTIAKIVYQPNYESAIWRVYFTSDGQLTFKNFYVTFEWYILELDEVNLGIYNDITLLINWIEDISVENTDLKSSLDVLRKNLNNVTVVTPVVVTINEQLEQGWITISPSQKELLDSVLARLSNSDTIVSVWMSEYEKQKAEILAFIPESQQSKYLEMFDDFESTDITREQKVDILTWMWNSITKDGEKNWWLNWGDMIGSKFCAIFEYYDMMPSVADMCSTNGDDYKAPPVWSVKDSSKEWWLPWWLKVVLIILVWWLLAMWWVIIFFSIKARLNSASDEDEES